MMAAGRALARARSIRDRELRAEDREARGWGDVSRLWREHLQPHRDRLAVAALFAVLWAGLATMHVVLQQFAVDEVFCVPDGFPREQLPRQLVLLGVFVAATAAVWLVRMGSFWGQRWIVQRVGQDILYSLRNGLHDKLQALHLGYFDRTPTGRVMSRIMGDVAVVQSWATMQATLFVSHVATLVLALGILYVYDWSIALAVTVLLPAYAWLFHWIRPRIRAGNIALRRLYAQLYGRASERVSLVGMVKAYGAEVREARTFARICHENLRVAGYILFWQEVLGWVAGVLTTCAGVGVLYLVLVRVRDGQMSLGSALACYGAMGHVFAPVNGLTAMAAGVQGMLVALRRVFALIDEPVDVKPGAIHLAGMQGKVRFDHVTFSYPGAPEPALRDVSLAIAAGERVAIMGPSGAGKSTLFQLLLRFYDPQEGEVRVGGVHLADADPGSVRRHVRMVQQEPVLFSGTLAENIMFGRWDATPSQVMHAAKLADIHEFIMALPAKYETMVGEKGVTLSGGQRQRLALATALLTDPQVLLLDDTTSALDAATEARIRETLQRALAGRTSLIITHRIATARDCDRIVVLEKGQVTQQGTHGDLVGRDGFYRRIASRQAVASDG